eukprot:GSChrysophyteH1.ASY1.ANO1.1283.1 assembled CDS
MQRLPVNEDGMLHEKSIQIEENREYQDQYHHHEVHVSQSLLSTIQDSFARNCFVKESFFCPEDFVLVLKERNTMHYFSYTLKNWYERLFVVFEVADSCTLASIIYAVIIATIVVNIVVNIMMTLPEWRSYPVTNCPNPVCDNEKYCPNKKICEPTVDPMLVTIDDVCVVLFAIDYLIRALVAAVEGRNPRQDPVNPAWYHVLPIYMFRFRNFVDFISILPFFITLFASKVDTSLSFIRVFRLLRIFRALGGGGGDVHNIIGMLQHTVSASMQVISFILVIGIILIFIYGSIMFDLELGNYYVGDGFKDGAYVRTDLDGIKTESPFKSSLSGMYWAVVTMTTVGYGDIVPFSVGGQIVASSLMILGILFMALPIAILGSKVTLEYSKLDTLLGEAKRHQKEIAMARRVSIATGVNVEPTHELDSNVPTTSVRSDREMKISVKSSSVSHIQIPTNSIRSKSLIDGIDLPKQSRLLSVDQLSKEVVNAKILLSSEMTSLEKDELTKTIVSDLKQMIVDVKSEVEFDLRKCTIMLEAVDALVNAKNPNSNEEEEKLN